MKEPTSNNETKIANPKGKNQRSKTIRGITMEGSLLLGRSPGGVLTEVGHNRTRKTQWSRAGGKRDILHPEKIVVEISRGYREATFLSKRHYNNKDGGEGGYPQDFSMKKSDSRYWFTHEEVGWGDSGGSP